MQVERAACKICGSTDVEVLAHTGRCRDCGVLLYWPYPSAADLTDEVASMEAGSRSYFTRAAYRNHSNFTSMLRFATEGIDSAEELDILDYGGGGGQFALIVRSHFPMARVYVTDICDAALLSEWSPLNIQVRFSDFSSDERKFDRIFLNDVFEHVDDPIGLLVDLKTRLKSNGIIFIDTPRQFWLYPGLRWTSKDLYSKLLKGTVSRAHLQLWTSESFLLAAKKAGLAVRRFEKVSEYTMPTSFYLRNMGISNSGLKALARMFYGGSHVWARNKILCLLESPI